MRTALLVAAVLAALAAAVVQFAQQASAEDRSPRASKHHPLRHRVATAKRRLAVRHVVTRIQRLRKATWHWQAVLGDRRTPASQTRLRRTSPAYRQWVLGLWKHRATTVWIRARRPPHKRQWLCIHRYEGAWNDPDAPYYGGLQMDLGFQQAYGSYLLRTKGTADRWSPLEQMWVAERAHATRGFYPWPNTARMCGLI
jgi:hypothetical protein